MNRGACIPKHPRPFRIVGAWQISITGESATIIAQIHLPSAMNYNVEVGGKELCPRLAG